MNPERWAQIEELFHRATECDAEQRAALLDEACRGDVELRRQVETLLASEETASDDIQAAVRCELEAVTFPLVGEIISHYRILDGLGRGGMGSVYRAEDIKLGRQVALKFLPEESTKNPAALRRFEREARAASALEHPNICPIYEFGEHEGQPFLAMQLLKGQTLREVISSPDRARVPPPVDELLDLAIQIAGGLEAAHSHGIIHRDIKPANIFLTSQGQAVILDFGLAKLFHSEAIEDEWERTPHEFATVRTQANWKVIPAAGDPHASLTGAAIGTAGYMSPEQLRGERLDARTDLFSFGVVLYEVATGKRPFTGDTSGVTFDAILSRQPVPPAGLDPKIPQKLEEIINKCLEKDREIRCESAAELLADLRRLKRDSESSRHLTPVHPVEALLKRTPIRLKRLLYGSIVAVLLIILGMTYHQYRRLTGKDPIVLAATTHRQLTFTGEADSPAISPQGDFVAYRNEGKLMVQDISGGQPIQIASRPNSIFNAAPAALTPRWTPDGVWIIFGAMESDLSRSGTYIVPRMGGSAQRLARYGLYTALSPDGNSLLVGGPPWLTITYLKTTEERDFTDKLFKQAGYVFLRDADWSPRGNWIVLQGTGKDEMNFLALMSPDGSIVKTVLQGQEHLSSPRWNSNGDALYYIRTKNNNPELVKAKIDPQSGAVLESRAILTGLPLGGIFGVSQDRKKLAYSRVHTRSHLWLVEVQEENGKRETKTRQLTSGTQDYSSPAISQDGKSLVFSAGVGPKKNLYLLSLAGGTPQQLTFLEGLNGGAQWSPDGKELAFGSNSSGRPLVMILAVAGGQAQIRSQRTLSETYSISWSPDGTRILYELEGNRNFGVIDLRTGKETDLVSNDSVGWMFAPVFSPDGTKVAVTWNRKDGRGLWVISLKDKSQTFVVKNKDWSAWPISWSADGRSIYYMERHGKDKSSKIWSVPASGGSPRLYAELPFKARFVGLTMTIDGKRLVCQVYEEESDIWLAENFDPDVK